MPSTATPRTTPRTTTPVPAGGLPRYVDDEDAFGAEGPVLTHLSPGQGVLELELRDLRLLPPAELPEVTGWTRRYLVTLLEVLSGLRPPQQLLRWSSTEIYSGVQRKAALHARARSRVRPAARGSVRAAHVSSLRVSFPRDGVAEVGAVLRDGDRVKAAALRVERCTDRSGDRWRVTALEMR